MASHGWWCGSRTYPTKCPYCGREVFFFTCDCGSKVFFDSLGWPWPIHDCTDRILRQIEGEIAEGYVKGITERRYRRRERRPPIQRCEPRAGERVENVGVVREILDIDVFEKFKFPYKDSPVSIALLGSLARGTWKQITVHIDSLDSEDIKSYTFLIKAEIWEQAAINREDLVYFVIEGQTIPQIQSYWLCREIESVF